ncbi:MAG TPA: helix-turn-helix transcriptional regulator [Iamia sp.]|nr:helix-turn-helix transcriptional regulator [Iamia sp.]
MEKSIGSPDHQRLAQRLRELREDAGLRQVELAERLGVTQSFVSNVENGERRLDLIELRQVCRALDADLVELVREFA